MGSYSIRRMHKNTDPLTPNVLKVLETATGLADAEAWRNIWTLISKSEHDNSDPKKAFLTDKGDSLFAYASALSYDFKKRGVTMGLVGWTSADDGKDGHGDAPELFKIYKSLGGDDLMKYVPGCAGNKEKCDTLIKKIKEIGDDPKWIEAQWTQLVSDSPDGAYIFHTMKAWKKVGVSKPSALALATVLDASLNQGFDGNDGGCTNLIKLAVHGNEDATLEKYNKWRRKVAGTSEYNSPKENGWNRSDMFEDLRKAKCFSLKGCDAQMKKAMSWEMK
jgi:chitosanase